jgi:hypothetical protein
MTRQAAVFLAAMTCLADVRSGLRAYDRHDFATAFREWSDAAARGSGDAQYHLALLYRDGEGVARDYAQARHWFQLSATQGYKGAANELGLLHMNGQGGQVDYPTALRLFTKASQFSSAALFNVGLMHEMGRGVEKSALEACAWYTVAAEQGSKGAPRERDYNCSLLSPTERLTAKRRISAIHRARAFRWMGTEGLYWAGIFRNVVSLIAGIYYLFRYASWRYNWPSRGLPDEARRRYRVFTGTRARRWFLWYRPHGVLAWALHGIYYAVLALSAITFAALAAIPFTGGSVGLAILVLGMLAAVHAVAVWRDQQLFAAPADNRESDPSCVAQKP